MILIRGPVESSHLKVIHPISISMMIGNTLWFSWLGSVAGHFALFLVAILMAKLVVVADDSFVTVTRMLSSSRRMKPPNKSAVSQNMGPASGTKEDRLWASGF